MSNTLYDWIVVGGGVSGISLAEILCRSGQSVLLIEKNKYLASETSGEFHEWLHSGALYTLAQDNLRTLRYLLGATDDLIQFYSSFKSMNLMPTEQGFNAKNNGWFNPEKIEYKYRIRKLNPLWMALVSRSINIIDQISKHDWLRRKAGSEYGKDQLQLKFWINHVGTQLTAKEKFYSISSPDITINSRILLEELLNVSIDNGLDVVLEQAVVDIKEENNRVSVTTPDTRYIARNVVICSPDVIANQLSIPIKTAFAPMAVVQDVPDHVNSFVELDYKIKSCINLIKKPSGIGQIGGITVQKESEILPYISYVLEQHKKRNPEIKILDTYVGVKKELVSGGQERNYLYHINQNSTRIWSVVLGKFTLAFSMAPEFHRRVFGRNPYTQVSETKSDLGWKISPTTWEKIVRKKDSKDI